MFYSSIYCVRWVISGWGNLCSLGGTTRGRENYLLCPPPSMNMGAGERERNNSLGPSTNPGTLSDISMLLPTGYLLSALCTSAYCRPAGCERPEKGNRRDVGDSFMCSASSNVQAIMSIAERFYQVLIIMTHQLSRKRNHSPAEQVNRRPSLFSSLLYVP